MNVYEREAHIEGIYSKLRAERVSLRANDNIGGWLTEEDRAVMRAEAEDAIRRLLNALIIDEQDPNVRDTPRRVAKMYLDEVFAGRYQESPPVTSFPNERRLDEVYTVGPITVRSACSHHLCPILGHAWIGVIPGHRLIGLSKFNRLAEWILSRPQIQEEAAVMLADELETQIAPLALAVVIRASHFCMSWRGVRDEGGTMTTSVMRGLFRERDAARAEFMRLIAAQGFGG